jgi:predicted PurR-regulated permease PerM
MAAIFAGLLYPLYNRMLKKVKKRTTLAAMITMLLFIIIILIPVSGILIVVADQALNASKTAGPLLKQLASDPNTIYDHLNSIPFVQEIFPEEEKLVEIINNLVKRTGTFVVEGLSSFSASTADFVFKVFIFLFSLYYFIIYGRVYLNTLLYYLPLNNDEEELLLARFTKVTIATLKGTFIIGIVQGALGAATMALLGIPNTLFWGMIMVVLSIIPALGPAIVWLPAAIYLIVQGSVVEGVILILVGAIIIGNIDNFLRPKLVGKGAQMPDLMILFSTLGGLAMFGIAGIIIGPIIAALFITVWDIYGKAFKDYLAPVSLDIVEIVEQSIESISPDAQSSIGTEKGKK